MKRIVSLCLTLVMVFSLPTMAFATSSSVRNINDDAVAFLDMHHIEKENLISVEARTDLPKAYVYQLTDSVRSTIIVEERENSHFLTIKEDSLVNTLEITNDGRYILNGNVITFSGSDLLGASQQDVAVPLYATDTFYTDDCPYGTASDYTKFVTSDAESNISFGTAFVNITLAAFTTIIGAVVNPILGLGATFALAILTSFQSYDPHSMCASYKENQYVHKNKGAFVTLEKSVLMYDMELWPQANYAGTSVSRIAYKVTLWENGEA